MQPTREQRAAIHTQDKNLIVVAGAGSGKTRILVERYLQLLESNPDWPISALVAITFTREAAFEMRHRARQELEALAIEPGSERWARRLVQMDSARIDTIHGSARTSFAPTRPKPASTPNSKCWTRSKPRSCWTMSSPMCWRILSRPARNCSRITTPSKLKRPLNRCRWSTPITRRLRIPTPSLRAGRKPGKRRRWTSASA